MVEVAYYDSYQDQVGDLMVVGELIHFYLQEILSLLILIVDLMELVNY